MLILNSYYMANDTREWRERLETLTNTLAASAESAERGNPKVLIIGSPVFFPNYKIPFQLQAAGIEICGNIDPAVWKFETAAVSGSKDLFTEVVLAALDNDCSGAYTQNDALRSAAEKIIAAENPDGIVWHILKGQIEYDFELLRLEPMFEKIGLPVLRLETDYQYQDVEQLRIRIEAFGELLRARKQ
jgi:benzoyl-CoA reductase/2-hydroxyglutaryl-CoA dehydratase subunit BcrC/BadD/HgdB